MLVALKVVTVLCTSNYVGGNFDEDNNDNSKNNQTNDDNIWIMIIMVMLTKSF